MVYLQWLPTKLSLFSSSPLTASTGHPAEQKTLIFIYLVLDHTLQSTFPLALSTALVCGVKTAFVIPLSALSPGPSRGSWRFEGTGIGLTLLIHADVLIHTIWISPAHHTLPILADFNRPSLSSEVLWRPGACPTTPLAYSPARPHFAINFVWKRSFFKRLLL